MRRSRFFRVLAAAVVLALLMLAIPITPALGVATISLSVSSGPPDTIITVSSNTDFDPSTSAYAWFDTNGDSIWTTGEPRALFMTDGTGAIPVGIALVIPSVARDTYSVKATDGTNIATTAFTITPKVVLADDEGYVGDTVVVDGSGFLGTATVTIYYDGSNVGTKTTNSYGIFDNFTFTVPASTEGLHDIKARDTTGYTPEVPYDVSPKITISPISGAVGDTVTVSGTGFDGTSTVTITFDGTTQTSGTTNSSGTLAATTFTVPETSRGSHTVRAQDSGANYATTTFSVAQNITLNPTTGPSGTTVTITGNGFGASKAITIKYNAVSVTTSPASVTTNSLGYFTATFTVPVGVAGTYEVVASDSTNTATANFVSTTDATISETTSTTDPGHVGMELTIEGVGFTPNATVTVKYTLSASESDTLATVTTGATGNFTAPFTIPPSAGGVHTITASDGTVVKTFTFVMESLPPPTPELTLPLEATKLKDRLFEWTAVEDVSPASDPVTYDIQIATDANFTTASTLISVTGLTTATYTIPEEEELESTGEDAPYYWHVRAVDAASNASAWSAASTFTIGWSFEFTGWVVWVTMAVVAILFFFLGLWLGRRGGGGEYF
jgi:hypothetical protein